MLDNKSWTTKGWASVTVLSLVPVEVSGHDYIKLKLLSFHFSSQRLIYSMNSRAIYSVCVCVLVPQLCLTLCDPMDCSQASLPMGFSRQKYWSGLPCPFPGDLPSPGIEPRSPTLQADSLPAEPQGSPRILEWVAYPFSRESS